MLQYYGLNYIVPKVIYFHMMEEKLDGSSNSFVRVVKLYTLNIWVQSLVTYVTKIVQRKQK